MMAKTKPDTEQIATFARWMRLGQVAHTQGDHKLAHTYWQKAAMLQPDNEQVWTALMWVLTDDNDRRVCLQNILKINPNNAQARELLDTLLPVGKETEDATAQGSPTIELDPPEIDISQPVTPVPVRYILLRLVEIITLAALLAIGVQGLRWLLSF